MSLIGWRHVLLAAATACASCKSWHRSRADAGGPTGEVADASVDAGADAGVALGPTYRSPVGGFQIRFPESKAPEVEDKAIAGGAAHLFKVQYGTSAYVVTYDDFAKGSSRTAQQVLDGARDGIVESTGGTIDSEHSLTLDGHPGLEFAVTATTAGIKMRQRLRVYFVDGRLYQTLIVAPTWSGATHFEQDFLDSFKLL